MEAHARQLSIALVALLGAAVATDARGAKPPAKTRARVGQLAAAGVRQLGTTVDRVAQQLVAAGERQAQQGHAGRGRALTRFGRGLKTALGSETLANTSCSFWVSAGVAVPVPLIDARIGGSLAVYSGKPKNDFSDPRAWAVGGAAAGPVQQLWSSYEGRITSVTPIWIGPLRVTASSSDVKQAVTAQIPFSASATIGVDKDRDRRQPDGTIVHEEGRGPFIGGAIPVGPVAIGGCLYYPPLQGLAEKVAVPAAALDRVQGKLAAGLAGAARRVRGLGARLRRRAAKTR